MLQMDKYMYLLIYSIMLAGRRL